MIPVTHRKGQTCYVFGLGMTGVSAMGALLAGGANVIAWDDRQSAREAAEAKGATTQAPGEVDWSALDALVLSPGVPLTHPEPHDVVKLAHKHGVAIVGDTELFVCEFAQAKRDGRAKGAKLIAITGTNGKSTTTALLGHVLQFCGVETEIGGNIGSHAVLDLKPFVNLQHYVIEFSSYQIDLTPSLKPDVAVFLNLSPDHLDRHGDFAGYAAVKAKIFAKLGEGDTLVLGNDDQATAAMQGLVPAVATCVPISQDRTMPGGVYCLGEDLFDAREPNKRGEALMAGSLAGIRSLRGAHNRQNAAAVYAAATALGLQADQIMPALASFGGLAHRMEEVGALGKVVFVNDSKATNADSAAKALSSFNHIHWILGGLAKADGIEPLRSLFGRVEHAYLIGEAAEEFAISLDGAVPFSHCGSLDVAVAEAAKNAAQSRAAEPVVLLAPACASFDQFANFELRGEAFQLAYQSLVDISLGKGEAK